MMKKFKNNSDCEWEKFGKDDPYFGVITQDKFRKSNLSEQNKKDFFNSGFDYIDTVMHKVKQFIEPDFSIKKALDFGCGVGRLVVPLAAIAEQVTGIDVSDSMLNEARENCKDQAITNVDFIKSDDDLTLVKGQYNFIHSFIVFQHISIARGEQIFAHLLEHLDPGGVCVVHFTYAHAQNSLPKQLAPFIKRHVPLAKNFINLINGKDFFAPQMQMNSYDLNPLFLMIQKYNVAGCYTEFTDHGGHLGLVVYFKKP